MTAMISRFFWAQQDEDQKIHWLSAEKLTRFKKEGGLGFKDLHTFNLAMSRAGDCSTTRTRYYPDMDILHGMRKQKMGCPMHGEAFCKVLRYSTKESSSEWAWHDGKNL